MNHNDQQKADQSIAVLCIGNILMCDDGVGPRVAQELLKRFDFPPNVEVLDRGTMGMALLSEFKQFDVILLVDAVDGTGEQPGTVVTFLPDEIASYEVCHGAHDTRFIDVLEAAALLGYRLEGHCLGVQVGDRTPVEYTIGLTPAVEAALPLLLESICAFLSLHGIILSQRIS